MKSSNSLRQKPVLTAVKAIVIGAVSGAVLCAVLLALCALLFVTAENVPQDFLSPFVIAVSALGSFFAGFVTAKILKQRGLICGIFSGILLFILFLVSGVAASHGIVSAETGTRLLVMLLSGGIGGLISVSRKSKHK